MADDKPAPRARPLTRAQAVENAAFLRALRRTGNAREAALSLGFNRSTFTKRRAKHPAFAVEWTPRSPPPMPVSTAARRRARTPG